MSILVFKPEDFDSVYLGKDHKSLVADRANELYNDWLLSQPTVYGDPEKTLRWSPAEHAQQTHAARLVDIRVIDIKKER